MTTTKSKFEKFAITAALMAVISLYVPLGQAQQALTVPHLVRFSGIVKEAAGKPVAGVTFALYRDQQGGAPVWMETQNVPLDDGGQYTVMLGATKNAGLPMEAFASGEARWLGVQPEGQPEQPRVLLLSVPYALKAADAETVGGLPASAFVLAAPPLASSPGSASPAADTSTPGPSLAGSGTINFIPLWTSSTGNLGNSVMFQSGTGSTAKIGINTTTPSTTLDVKGGATIRGALTLPATGAATATAGKNSQPFNLTSSTYNSGTGTAVPQNFRWQSEPTRNNTANAGGTLNLLFGSGSNTPAETGLMLASNGKITFAPGQTFPGTLASVGLTAPGSDFTVSGSPVTGSGTLGLGWTVAPTSADTANAIVKRDAGGNFSATQINAASVVATNTGTALAGTSSSGAGAVTGTATATGTGPTYGVVGNTSTTAGGGVLGQTNHGGYGVLGLAVGTSGQGVRGEAFGTQDSNFLGPDGVDGFSHAAGASGVGGFNSANGYGVYGSGGAYGVYGTTTAAESGTGVYGAGAFGVYGNSTTGTVGGGAGVKGTSFSTVGVEGVGTSTFVIGVSGTGGSSTYGDGPGGSFEGGRNSMYGDGIDVYAGSGYAAYFSGNVYVDGTISASGAKNFKIDHPLDPANRYLVHASVESSEMLNIYTGNITTDGQGEALVQLPQWFGVLNTDFRYQLTVIGQFAQAIVAREIENNQFTIKTSVPNSKVSWQVTGVRQDAWAKAHPLVVEEDKEARLRGYYLQPELYGASDQQQIEWARHPPIMKRMKERRAKLAGTNKPETAVKQ